MTTQIDFYLLENPEQSLDGFCCKLVEKAYRAGHDIFIQIDSDERLSNLDDLLWTFRQDSFLPHATTNSEALTRASSPIRLGRPGENQGKKEMLINLSTELSADFSQYQRVSEIVSCDEGDKVIGRSKFKAYQTQGIRPTHHKIA